MPADKSRHKARPGDTVSPYSRGFCYLDLIRTLANAGCAIDTTRAATQFGPFPLFRRVAALLMSYAERDYLVPCVRMVSPTTFHVDRHGPPMRLSHVISLALFTDARIGADSAITHAEHLQQLTSLCKTGGVQLNDILAEAARKQLNKCMNLPESFLMEALRPLMTPGKTSFPIPYRLDPADAAALQLAFPELNVVTTGNVAHSHAYAAAATLAAEELILRMLRYDSKAKVPAGYDAAIVDVGANYPRHAKNGRSTVHCCVPIMDVRDSARETTRYMTLQNRVAQGKLTAATANEYTDRAGTKKRCFNRAQCCNVRAPAMMLVHSQYDIPIKEMEDIFDAHEPLVAISVMNFVPSIMYEESGVAQPLGLNFRRVGSNIVFDFVGDSSMAYQHDLDNLKTTYCNQHIVTKKGRVYLCERFLRGSALFLQYTYCAVQPEVRDLRASFSFWDTVTADTVVLSIWEHDMRRFAGSKLRTLENPTASFKRKILEVDRRFYDLLYSHCIRSGEKSFNFNECFSAALTFNTKMSINGNDVRSMNRVSSVDLMYAVVAVYCIAYRDRFHAGKNIEAYVANEKQKRAQHTVGFTNFFGAVWRRLSEGVFDNIKTFWNDLLDKVAAAYEITDIDAMLMQSVRKIEYSEFLRVHGKYEDRLAEIDDPSVQRVDVKLGKDGMLAEVIEIVRDRLSEEKSSRKANDPQVVVPHNEPLPQICSNRQVRLAKTEVHRRYTAKTTENSMRLREIRKGHDSCRENLVRVRMPGDGHCVFHTLGALVNRDVRTMRAAVHTVLADDSLLDMSGSRAGWGSLDVVTAFSKIFGYRVCVHIDYNGTAFRTTYYTDESVPDDAPVRHIYWRVVGNDGHADLLQPDGGYPRHRDDGFPWDPKPAMQGADDDGGSEMSSIPPSPSTTRTTSPSPSADTARTPTPQPEPARTRKKKASNKNDTTQVPSSQLEPAIARKKATPRTSPAAQNETGPSGAVTAPQPVTLPKQPCRNLTELNIPPFIPVDSPAPKRTRSHIDQLEWDDNGQTLGDAPMECSSGEEWDGAPIQFGDYIPYVSNVPYVPVSPDHRDANYQSPVRSFENVRVTDEFLAMYDLDEAFVQIPASDDPISVWIDMGDLALANGTDILREWKTMGVYDERVHYDMDSLRAMLRPGTYGYVGPEIPEVLATHFRNVGESGDFDYILSDSFDPTLLARSRIAYIVRMKDVYQPTQTTLGDTVTIVRAQFTAANDMTAYAVYMRPGAGPLYLPNWFESTVKLFNGMVRKQEPYHVNQLRLMLGDSTAGALLDLAASINHCDEHITLDIKCVKCVCADTVTKPVHMQSVYRTLKQKLAATQKHVNHFAQRQELFIGNEEDCVIRYIKTELQRNAKTGYKGEHIVGYDDVQRGKALRMFDKLTGNYAHSAVKAMNPGEHRVECLNGKTVDTVVYGSTSDTTVTFLGQKSRTVPATEPTKMAQQQAKLNRVHVSATVRETAKFVCDSFTSMSSTPEAYHGGERPRIGRITSRHTSMTTVAVQTDAEYIPAPPRKRTLIVREYLGEKIPRSSSPDAPRSLSPTTTSITAAMSSLTMDSGTGRDEETLSVSCDTTVTRETDASTTPLLPRKPKRTFFGRIAHRIRAGTSVASTDTQISEKIRQLDEQHAARYTTDSVKHLMQMLPRDPAQDNLVTSALWINYPWDTDVHIVCVATRGNMPESFKVRRGLSTVNELAKSPQYPLILPEVRYNHAYNEFVLVNANSHEDALRRFMLLLPEDCKRASLEVACPLAEIPLANIITSTRRKLCLVAQRDQRWSGVLSIVDPVARPLKPKSVPIAFPKLSKEELGFLPNPPWLQGNTKSVAYKNAMVEYKYITAHADNFNKATFRRLNFDSENGSVFERLEILSSEGIYVFENSTTNPKFLGTKPRLTYSHAYSAKLDDYVPWNDKTNRYDAPDKYLLVNKFTQTMLNASIIKNIGDVDIMKQEKPRITWINGPPGCGKTYTIVQTSVMSASKTKGVDLVLSMTKEGRKAICVAMATKNPTIPEDVIAVHVRTVASVLVNGSVAKYERVLMDEALMGHAGAIGYVAALTSAQEVLIIGDINQIPFVDRDHMCELKYYTPAAYADITRSLRITYRCPVDVTYALESRYPGLCTKSTVVHSVQRRAYTMNKAAIRKDLPDCLYLVHFQADKDMLMREGYGSARTSAVLTIHEAQGLTYKNVICIRTNPKPLGLYDRVEYAIVAVSRHTETFVYYTDKDDALTKIMAATVLDRSRLLEWNRAHLAEALAELNTRAGGLLYESEMVLQPMSFDTDENLTAGLPHHTHAPLRPTKCHRVVNALRRAPSWKAAAEQDIAYLQAFYDSAMPGVAQQDYDNDQLLMENEDTALHSTDVVVLPQRGIYMPPRYGTLRPRVRTIMQKKKVRSQLESLNGAIKRNLNAPVLINEMLSPAEIGRALFTNFVRSGIDPLKRHIYEQYGEDTVNTSTPIIAEWLEKQPPSRRTQIVSELPLHLRPYNVFSYMVKTDVKPQLTPSAANTYPSVQTIIYNDPSVNVIFCPIFNILFERLISVLHPKILLLTGLSKPDFEKELNARIAPELARRLRTIENDFSKFDKAQAEALRVLEDLLWRSLGLDPDLAEIWDASRRKSHVRDRDGGISFRTEFQRKSGEATTFSGNTLVSICVVLGVVDIDDIVLLLGAGDDTLVFVKDSAYITDASRLIADLFNLECKLLDRYHVPYFCSAFIVPTTNWTYVVPDPLKFVTKLGRHDMKNYAHVEEYRVSCVDTMQSLFNSEVTPVLSLGVAERYGGHIQDLSKLQSVLRTLCYDPVLFASLFVLDRNVVIYDPKQKVKGRRVTAELVE